MQIKGVACTECAFVLCFMTTHPSKHLPATIIPILISIKIKLETYFTILKIRPSVKL